MSRIIFIMILSLNLQIVNSQCREFMVTFNFINYPDLNVHELIISDSINRFIVVDTTSVDTIVLPYIPRCSESPCTVWNLPFPCNINKKEFKTLDSILYNKTNPLIQEYDSTLKDKTYLQIRYCDGTDKGYYDRFVEFSSDFYKIFEFAYLLETNVSSTGGGCNYWIFDYLDMSHHVEFNTSFFEQEYEVWKKQNKK